MELHLSSHSDQPPICDPHVAWDLAKLVPEAAIGNIIEVRVPDDNDANDPSHMFRHEQEVIRVIASRIDAKRIFEFGPRKDSRTFEIARELSDETQAIVTDQLKSGAIQFDKSRMARQLTHEAMERAEAIRHVDSFRGNDSRLLYAPWVGACDLVMVNAACDYNYIKCDSLTALHLAKPGGVVLWSDYGVAPILTECLNSLYKTVRTLASLRQISGTNLCFWRRCD